MFNIGGFELLVIAAVALLVLGPDKLPKFMRTVGKTVGQVRRVSTEFQRTMNMELAGDSDEDTKKNLNAGHDTAQEIVTSHVPQDDNDAQAASAAVNGAESGPAEPAPARRKLARPKGGASGGLARAPRRTGGSSPKHGNGPEQA